MTRTISHCGSDGRRGFQAHHDRHTARRGAHASNNLAKLSFLFQTTVPRARLRPKYGQGFGRKSGREKDIEYRERSPLVIPPSNTLLPPETDAATKNPNWPVDPEVKLQKQLRAAEHNRAAGSSSDEFVNDAKPVSVYDMTKALDKGIEIQDVYLLSKTGGKSGEFRRVGRNK